MALTYRLYRTARIGSGTKAIPYDTAMSRYRAVMGYRQWIHDPTCLIGIAAGARYLLASGDTTAHTTAAADPDITALSPEQASIAAMGTWLDGQIGTLSATVATILEGDGVPVDDIATTDTRRKLLRRIALLHRVWGYLREAAEDDALSFFRAAMSSTGPISGRGRLLIWLQNHGVDTSDIDGSTTVRELIKKIVQRVNVQPYSFGDLSF